MTRNLLRLGFWYGGSFVITLVLALVFGAVVHNTFSSILQGFFTMVTVAAAMSFVFFTYTDNVEQKLSDLYNKSNELKIDQAHDSIEGLKREIILNGISILGMALLEKLVSGIDLEKYLIFIGHHKIEASLAGVACRMSLFILALLVLTDQVRAFLTAMKLRPIISKGASKLTSEATANNKLKELKRTCKDSTQKDSNARSKRF